MKITKPIKLLITAAITFVVIFAVSAFPAFAEWYSSNVYPIIAAVLSFVSGIFPFSLFDIFITLLVLSIFALIFLVIFRKIKFTKALYILAYSVIIIVAWFYVSWGFSYFRHDFYKRCNVEKSEFNAENFETFAQQFIADANAAYVDISVFDEDKINAEIENQYKKLKDVLKIKYPNGTRRTKKMLYRKVQSAMGISGYFGPFFNEVHVNRFALDFEIPFLLAHEKAHQFGVASEAECNFYAFVICATSNNSVARYSAYVSIIKYVLSNYRKIFPEQYKDFISQVNPAIIDDLNREYEHWIGARNETLANVQNAAYNAYLKTNKISSGVQNYSEVVGMLVSTYDKFVK